MLKFLLSLLMLVSAFSPIHADIFQANRNQEAGSKSVRHWDDSNFANAIAKGVVVVDFYADWCGPCRQFAPAFESVAAEFEGAASFGKVNVDKGRKVSGNYNVSSIPTIIIFKDGKEIARRTGGASAGAFRDWVESYL